MCWLRSESAARPAPNTWESIEHTMENITEKKGATKKRSQDENKLIITEMTKKTKSWEKEKERSNKRISKFLWAKRSIGQSLTSLAARDSE